MRVAGSDVAQDYRMMIKMVNDRMAMIEAQVDATSNILLPAGSLR
jgi:hypothetical protein